MKLHMDIISSIVRKIDTGAALEYEFLFEGQNRVTAKCMNDPDKKVLEIPPSHKNIWRQPEHGANSKRFRKKTPSGMCDNALVDVV